MSEKRLVRARGQALRSPNTGLTRPRWAVHYPALHSHTDYYFRAGARTEKLGLYPNSFISQRSILEHVSICSPSQFIHLHGKPYRLFFERELDGLATRLFFERELDGPAPISVRVIATIGITHGRKIVSPSRKPCDSDGIAPISVRVIATIVITHGRKTVSPSRNPCDSDPFWSHSQSSTSVAKLFAFMRTTSICFWAGARTESHMGDMSRLFIYHRASAYGRPFEPDFSVRVIAYDKVSLSPSIGSLEQFWNTITLELRASLPAGSLRFHFFNIVWSCMVCTKFK